MIGLFLLGIGIVAAMVVTVLNLAIQALLIDTKPCSLQIGDVFYVSEHMDRCEVVGLLPKGVMYKVGEYQTYFIEYKALEQHETFIIKRREKHAA